MYAVLLACAAVKPLYFFVRTSLGLRSASEKYVRCVALLRHSICATMTGSRADRGRTSSTFQLFVNRPALAAGYSPAVLSRHVPCTLCPLWGFHAAELRAVAPTSTTLKICSMCAAMCATSGVTSAARAPPQRPPCCPATTAESRGTWLRSAG